MLPQIVIIIDELADLDDGRTVAGGGIHLPPCSAGQSGGHASHRSDPAPFRRYRHRSDQSQYSFENRFCGIFAGGFQNGTLDRAGAEKLVGKGDMLFNPIGKAQAERLQGPFVTDEEVNAVIEFWKAQAEESDGPNRIMGSINTVKIDIGDEEERGTSFSTMPSSWWSMRKQASASMLQRRFRIGYNRAGRLVDICTESRGIIGPSEGSKPRQGSRFRSGRSTARTDRKGGRRRRTP